MVNRREQILNLLSRDGETSVNSLSDTLSVSLVTIRSDLRALEEEGLLIRTHGGAALPPVDDISHRLSINYTTKQRIAEAAAGEVEEGDTVLLEAGSCVALMARALADRKNLNVITNNAFVARQLKDSPSVQVILMGGFYQKESETMVGPMISRYLEYYNFSKVFLGMDGFSWERGVMCRNFDRAEVMSGFIGQGARVYVLSDSGKIGRTAVRSVCTAEDVDCLITDRGIPADFRTKAADLGMTLIDV